MPYTVADRVKETTAITGTGPATLLGAVSGYRSFASQLSIGDTCAYAIVSSTGLEWEVGIGTYSATNTLTRTTVQSSTNSNAAVNFGAGTKDVFLGPTAGSVPNYNPITNSLAIDYVDVDTTASVAGAVGRLKWNDTDGTLDLGMKGGNVTQQIGEESFVRARNNTGSTLLDGMVVRLTGSIGTRATVALAQANTQVDSSSVIGLLTEDIANNDEGFVTTYGLVRNLNTSALTEGGLVYLSATIAGGLTSTAPNGPNHRIVVGICVRSHVNMGSILVGVQDAGELSGLSDVSISSPTDGQILKYDGVAQVWENAAASVDLATGVTGILPVANGGTGVTTATGSGSVVLSNTPTLVTPQTNSINAVPVVSGAGNSLTLAAGSGVGTGAGGSLVLQAGIQATSGGDGKVVVKQVAGQTSNLQEWQDSSGNIRGYISATDSSTIARFSLERSGGSEGFYVTTTNGGTRGLWLTGSMSAAFGCTSVNNTDGGSIVTGSAIATRGDVGEIGFGAGTNPVSRDVVLRRDAADTLAQRRSTNPQTFRLYNTFTNASNYERLGLTWSSNICTIGLAQAGTGSTRNLVVAGANATTGAGGNVTITAGNGSGVGAGGNIILQPGAQGTSGGDGKIRINTSAGVDTGFNFTNGFASYPTLDQNRLYIRSGLNSNLIIELNAQSSNMAIGGSGAQFSLASSQNANWVGFKEKANAGVLSVICSSTTVGSSFSFPNATTAIAANTNDLALPASAFQRLNCTTACSLTGIAPVTGTGSVHVDGRMIRIYNVGAANLTLSHNSASSTPANKFWNSTGADIVLSTHQYVELIYDSTDNGRGGAGWRVSSVH